jgi:hypothetical protein
MDAVGNIRRKHWFRNWNKSDLLPLYIANRAGHAVRALAWGDDRHNE